MNKENNFIEKIKKENLPVIIFGAGIVGEVLHQACCSLGIKVECFCDNNINKTGKLLCDTEVIHTSKLKTRYKDAVFLISAADIKDVIGQLRSLDYYSWHEASHISKDFDIYSFKFSAPIDFVEYAVSTAILCQNNYLASDKLFIRSVDIIITERCSLRCRDCSNLMQYYKEPKDCDIDIITRSIDALCSLADEINEFRVIGGEPFMNKEIHLVIKKLVGESKVRKIVIYTNGTIVPGEEYVQCLKDDKVLFIITDYGPLSRKIDALVKVLRENNIAYHTLKVDGWADCSGIIKHNRDADQQRSVFRNCCAKNLITLSDGKLFRCPYAANAHRLAAIPDCESDYINILNGSIGVTDISEMRNRVKDYLLRKEYLEACDYCNGRPYDAVLDITPAIQTKKSLEYKKI